MKIDHMRHRFWKLSTVSVMIALGLLMVAFVIFPVKAERWSTPTQVTFNLNIADDWGGPSISGDGTKVVFVQFKDDAGLVSDSYSDTIMLETVKENDFPGAFPTGLLVAGVAGIAAVAVALLYIKKRKTKVSRAAS